MHRRRGPVRREGAGETGEGAVVQGRRCDLDEKVLPNVRGDPASAQADRVRGRGRRRGSKLQGELEARRARGQASNDASVGKVDRRRGPRAWIEPAAKIKVGILVGAGPGL